MDPAELAKTEAAFAKGYRDADELMTYFRQHPGVPIGWDPEPDPWRPPPVGLGYSTPPAPRLVFEADVPGLVPHVLPATQAFDYQAPPSVTGSSHGWGLSPMGDIPPAGRGDSVVYAGLSDLGAERPRRSLWARLTGKGR